MLDLLAGRGGEGPNLEQKAEARAQGLLITRRKSGNLGDGMGKTQNS